MLSMALPGHSRLHSPLQDLQKRPAFGPSGECPKGQAKLHIPLNGINGYFGMLSPGVANGFEIFQHSFFDIQRRCSNMYKSCGHSSTQVRLSSRPTLSLRHTVQIVELFDSHEPKHLSSQQLPLSSHER